MSPKHTIYCLGEVLLALDADTPLAHAESFRPRLGGDAAVLAQACAAQGGCASLLAQLGEDPFGQRAASTLAAAGVDTTHASFSRTLPTALLFEAGGEALSYRGRTAGLQFAPEQLEPGLFQPGDALLFASSGLCDSPLRYTHLAAHFNKENRINHSCGKSQGCAQSDAHSLVEHFSGTGFGLALYPGG